MITQKQRAYDYIREKLIAGDLPPGSRLSDVALAKEIGISRTPVREAINQLASEDLVELIPHTGAFVKIPDEQELIELYDLRQLLETFVVSRASRNISAENLARLEEMTTHMDSIIAEFDASGMDRPSSEIRHRWVMTDYAFHLVLFRSCGNRKVMRIASDLRMLTQAFVFQKDDPEIAPLSVMKQANREHRQLFDALRNGDGRAAVEVITRHIDRAKTKTLANYKMLPDRNHKPEPDWLASVRDVIHS